MKLSKLIPFYGTASKQLPVWQNFYTLCGQKVAVVVQQCGQGSGNTETTRPREGTQPLAVAILLKMKEKVKIIHVFLILRNWFNVSKYSILSSILFYSILSSDCCGVWSVPFPAGWAVVYSTWSSIGENLKSLQKLDMQGFLPAPIQPALPLHICLTASTLWGTTKMRVLGKVCESYVSPEKTYPSSPHGTEGLLPKRGRRPPQGLDIYKVPVSKVLESFLGIASSPNILVTWEDPLLAIVRSVKQSGKMSTPRTTPCHVTAECCGAVLRPLSQSAQFCVLQQHHLLC